VASPAVDENIRVERQLGGLAQVCRRIFFDIAASTISSANTEITESRLGRRMAAFEKLSARTGVGWPSATHAPAAVALSTRPGTRASAMPPC
jgi:hypothetical protein